MCGLQRRKAAVDAAMKVEAAAEGEHRHYKRLMVQHSYHDHAQDPPPPGIDHESLTRSGAVSSFPIKLYDMLRRVEEDGLGHIVSWQPHGRAFLVRKPDGFKELLPQFFSLAKIASFQRQLNLYGFQRLTRGRDRGCYYHELFLRGKSFLIQGMQRIKVKGTGVRARSNPEQEPDLWNMEWVGASTRPQEVPLPPESHGPSPESVLCSFDTVPDQVPLKSRHQEEQIICGWGKPFHYLDAADMCAPHSSSNLRIEDLLQDDEIERTLGDLLFVNEPDLAEMLDKVVS